MIERILEKQFREMLVTVFNDIFAQKKREEVKSFNQDAERIKNELLTAIDKYDPLPTFEDFLVAGIDGSGSPLFMRFDDVKVHLLTRAAIVMDTSTTNGKLLTSVDPEQLAEVLGEYQPHIEIHWHSGERDDIRSKLAESIDAFYPVKRVREIVLPFFQDYLGLPNLTFKEIEKTSKYKKYIDELTSIDGLITRGQSLNNETAHDELRKVFEYSIARKLLDSDLRIKYLLLDGALSSFINYVRDYPSMPSGFMLRDICKRARERGTVVCAVSKDHTVPFAHQISELAKEKFSGYAKWFCRLPAGGKSGEQLHIFEDRTYIPPKLTIPYLYSFSRENRPTRIDFDLVWWESNVYDDDPEKLRENEQALFRDIEFISRDARWYGYPVPLALAHETCVLSYKDLIVAREIAKTALQAAGYHGYDSTSQRSDYNL